MARPIKETPTLHGEEARVFAEKVAHPRPVTREEVLRAERVYREVMANADFRF